VATSNPKATLSRRGRQLGRPSRRLRSDMDRTVAPVLNKNGTYLHPSAGSADQHDHPDRVTS
jgi:hypothetical protein